MVKYELKLEESDTIAREMVYFMACVAVISAILLYVYLSETDRFYIESGFQYRNGSWFKAMDIKEKNHE